MDFRTECEEYARIGADLIATEPELAYIRQSQARIGYLSSRHQKMANKKVICAECEKVADRNKWSIPYDFTITVFEPNVKYFDREQIRILLFHELLHVGIEKKNRTEKYSIISHDLEDFKTIINKYGVNWNLPKREE